MAALAEAGWRAIAPDLRGYGETGAQGELAAYSMRNLSLDVIGLMDALEIGRAVVVGHDFGGMLAWTLARDHPARIAGVASLNTPYTRRTRLDLVETMRRHRGETNYMVGFQKPGVGEALLERDIAATFDGLMRRPALTLARFRHAAARLQSLPMTLFTGEPDVMGDPVMFAAERAVYVDAYRRNGFTGPLNWYRNLHRNWLDTADVLDCVHQPALMISAADDFFLPPDLAQGMEDIVPDLEWRIIEHCGHWAQYEQPEKVNAILLNWLDRRLRPGLI